jgi:hypothetical protein
MTKGPRSSARISLCVDLSWSIVEEATLLSNTWCILRNAKKDEIHDASRFATGVPGWGGLAGFPSKLSYA